MEESKNKIIKIAVVGAESTGKTTLCEQLAKHYNTVFVPEYARDYFNTHSINNYSLDDLNTIAQQQIELENSKQTEASHFLFCDTTLITIKIWAQHRFNSIPSFVANNLASGDYDLFFLCNNDVSWQADKQRKHPNLRNLVFEQNLEELKKLSAPFHIISGTGSSRLQNAIKITDSLF